ncbi:MAG: LytTR family DNA-binding domain-containing protein [Bacillota bacterium]|nr:LytTR family DNA-binding domain-containing protein [Bacillota bacterium]
MKEPKQTSRSLAIAICDDEPILLEEIASRIKAEFEKRGIEAKCSLFEKGENLLCEEVSLFDVVFLDIELKTTNGLELAKKLRESSYSNKIVFITSFIDYVLDGYQADAFRFLLKNNLEQQLSECIEAIAEQVNAKASQTGFDFPTFRDVLYVMSENRTVTLFFKNGESRTEYMKLDEFEEKVNSKQFCRVHQSYLVNIDYVEFVRRYEVRLVNDLRIPISKSRYKEANRQIKLRRTLWA